MRLENSGEYAYLIVDEDVRVENDRLQILIVNGVISRLEYGKVAERDAFNLRERIRRQLNDAA